MKTIVLLGLFSLSLFALKAQNTNLIFFTEQGERFSVVLNGVLQNDKPSTNIKVTDLPAPSYKLKIIFEDKNLLEEGVGINVNDPYSGASMNINLNVGNAGTQTTTTTTTTTTTSGNQVNDPLYSDNRDDHDHDHGGHRDEPRYVLPGYNGEYGCPYPMSPADFSDAKRTIDSKNFEDSKLTIAKQIIGSNCLLSSQVRDLMELFTYETTKLEFAKFAYRYTLDIGNYYKVNDAFTYESSIDELNDYISGRKR
jgi:hypothetical protein